jgi:hypothetical protein
MIWESAQGVTTQWTAMGEGCTDLPALFDRLAADCPGVTAHIETISGVPRKFPVYDDAFWKPFPRARAEDFAAFLTLTKKEPAMTHQDECSAIRDLVDLAIEHGPDAMVARRSGLGKSSPRPGRGRRRDPSAFRARVRPGPARR